MPITEQDKQDLIDSANTVVAQTIDLMNAPQPPFGVQDQDRLREQASAMQQASDALLPQPAAQLDHTTVSGASERVAIAGHYLGMVLTPGENGLDRDVVFNAIDASIDRLVNCGSIQHVTTDHLSKVIAALDSDAYPWRTIKGVASEVGISTDEVIDVISSNRDSIVRGTAVNSAGEALFTTRKKLLSSVTPGQKILGAFKNRVY